MGHVLVLTAVNVHQDTPDQTAQHQQVRNNLTLFDPLNHRA
jgi:hypothetical protein